MNTWVYVGELCCERYRRSWVPIYKIVDGSWAFALDVLTEPLEAFEQAFACRGATNQTIQRAHSRERQE